MMSTISHKLAPNDYSDLGSEPIQTTIVKNITLKRAKKLYEDYIKIYVKCEDFQFRAVTSKAVFAHNPTFEYYICGDDVVTEVDKELSNEDN